MARKKDTPCAECGVLIWRPTRNQPPPGEAMCRACRGNGRQQETAHGTRLMYRERGCRCDEGRGWARVQMRAYVETVRAREGITPTQKARPRQSPICPCSVCGDPVMGRVASDRPMHNACRPEKYWANAIQISDRDRLAIYERDCWTCQLCGVAVDCTLDPIRDAMAATLDHIQPRSLTLFPDDSPENLRLAHRACNSARGNRVA